MRKEEALIRYEDAMAKGDQGIMTSYDQSARDILRFKIGGLRKGDMAVITVKMLKMLEVESECYLFRMPTSYYPRY